VSLFRFKQKDGKQSKMKRNEAKKMQNKTLSWREEAKLSETKRDCCSFAYMNPSKPFETKKKHAKSELVSQILLQSETCETGSFLACFFLV
jgi:hypothetical protein